MIDGMIVLGFCTLICGVLSVTCAIHDGQKGHDGSYGGLVCMIFTIVLAGFFGATFMDHNNTEHVAKLCAQERVKNERHFVCELQMPATVIFNDGEPTQVTWPWESIR